MTRILALSLALAGAMSVSACQTPQQQNALFGGTLGAGTGALIGSAASGGSAGGGAARGAVGGGARRERGRRARGRCDRRGHRRAARGGGDASAELLRWAELRRRTAPRLRWRAAAGTVRSMGLRL